MGIELARFVSIDARVLAIASSKAELPVWLDGEAGKGTSPGVTSALKAALEYVLVAYIILQGQK